MEKKGPIHRHSPRRLRIIKALVCDRRYNFSRKVQNFIEDGLFDLEDLEQCIIGARRIQKVEIDELGVAVDGYKYTIIGVDAQGVEFYTCGKIISIPPGRESLFFHNGS